MHSGGPHLGGPMASGLGGRPSALAKVHAACSGDAISKRRFRPFYYADAVVKRRAPVVSAHTPHILASAAASLP